MSKPSRRDEILQALAAMLESQPGARITTAALAREVGVSEAALYRHFPEQGEDAGGPHRVHRGKPVQPHQPHHDRRSPRLRPAAAKCWRCC